MIPILTLARSVAGLLIAAIAISGAASADELTPSLKKYLQELKVSENLMNGLDQDLAVPKEWLAGAEKEGTVRVLGSWTTKEFGILNAPFAER